MQLRRAVSKLTERLADMQRDLRACMWEMQICTATCTLACGRCRHAQRPARLHVGDADMHSDLHACMWEMQTCTATCTLACGRCRHAQRPARLHVGDADMHSDLHA